MSRDRVFDVTGVGQRLFPSFGKCKDAVGQVTLLGELAMFLVWLPGCVLFYLVFISFTVDRLSGTGLW
jgi:hypothetical protein